VSDTASLGAVEVHQGSLGAQLPFVLRLEHAPSMVVISINGELDMVAASQLDEAIGAVRADPPEEVVLDMSGLSFLDSSGIRALLRAQGACEACGCRLVMLRGPAQVQRILTVARVIERFCFAD
jgi:anti-sigma B factor antagonist